MNITLAIVFFCLFTICLLGLADGINRLGNAIKDQWGDSPKG